MNLIAGWSTMLRPGRCLSAVVVAGALACCATAAGADLVEVQTPRDRDVVAREDRAEATLLALAAAGASIDRVTVNGRALPPKLLRSARDGRALEVALAPYLRPGPNIATVRSRRGSELENESTTFTLARDEADLVQGDARPASDAPAAIGLAARRDLTETLLAVNGRRVRMPGGFAARSRTPLSATDGLRPGSNRIVVRALDRPDARVQFLRRALVLPRDRPVAGAGRDVTVPARTEVALDGSTSVSPDSARRGLAYRWSVVGKPPGAEHELNDAGTARPTFRPGSVPGDYEVRLTVTQPETGATSSDTVTVTATPDPLAPITALADVGGTEGVQILVDRECSPTSTAAPCYYPIADASDGQVQLLILERTTLALATDGDGKPANYAFPGSDLSGFAASLQAFASNPPSGSGSDYIAVVAGHTGGVTDVANFNAGAGLIGLPAIPTVGITTPFSVIGIPGMVEGKAASNFGQSLDDGAKGSLDGYIRNATETTEGITQSDRRVFDYGSPVTFDTRAPSSDSGVTRAIQIGDTVITDSGTEGIILVSFNRRTGAVIGSKVFGPLASDQGLDWSALATDIGAAIQADQGVVLASRGGTDAELSGFGSEPEADAFKGEFLAALAELGVNPDVIARSILAGNDQQQPNDAFSVVSGGGVGFLSTQAMVENVLSSSSAVDVGFEQGRLTGALRRAPEGAYQPTEGDPGPDSPSGFQEVLFAAPVAWPLTPAATATTASGAETALAYIATTPLSQGGLGVDDTNGEGKPLWTTSDGTTTVSVAAVREVALDLRAGYQLPDAQGCAATPSLTYASITPAPPFTEADFTTASTQLTAELNECREVTAWFAAQTTPISSNGIQETEQGVATNIVAQYFDSAESEQRAQATAAEVTQIVSIGAAAFSAVPQTASFGKVLKFAAGVSAATQPTPKTPGPTGSVLDGWDYLQEQLDQETAAINTQIDDTVTTITNGIGIAQSGIVSDWGRMTATSNNIESGAQWQITSDQQTQLQDAFLMYIRQIAYRLYMGDQYTAYRVNGENADWDRPKVENYHCTGTNSKPFNRANAGALPGYGATQEYWANNGLKSDGDPVAPPTSYVMVRSGWDDMRKDAVPGSDVVDDLFGAPTQNTQFVSETEYAAGFMAPLFWSETFSLDRQAHCPSTTKQDKSDFKPVFDPFAWYPYSTD